MMYAIRSAGLRPAGSPASGRLMTVPARGRRTGRLEAGAPGQDLTRVPAHATQLFSSARTEHGVPLDPRIRGRIEDASATDLQHVRVHSGPASSAAAHLLGARAYTVGADIHLGANAQTLPSADREKLLTHEAVHTAQQGARATAVTPSMPVSSPHDAGEREAHNFQFGTHVAPHVQRHLLDSHEVKDGTWDLTMRTRGNPGGKSGLEGTIQFTPSESAPDDDKIRIVQAARVTNLRGRVETFTGDEADRNKMMTRRGFFIDHRAADVDPRDDAADKPVSPYYRNYTPTGGLEGHKNATGIAPAAIFDFPGSTSSRRFEFETVAKGVNTNYHYGSLQWGFTIADADAGKIEKEHSSARRAPTATFHAALKKFNEFYRNPGTKKAPR